MPTISKPGSLCFTYFSANSNICKSMDSLGRHWRYPRASNHLRRVVTGEKLPQATRTRGTLSGRVRRRFRFWYGNAYPGGDAIGWGAGIGVPFWCGRVPKLDAEATMIWGTCDVRQAAIRGAKDVAKGKARSPSRFRMAVIPNFGGRVCSEGKRKQTIWCKRLRRRWR